jgi:hypothetical protein
MTRMDIEHEILDLIDDDVYGLWEVGWRLNTALGVDPQVDPRATACVVYSLIERKLAKLYVRQPETGKFSAIELAELPTKLLERSIWLEPSPGESEFWIG